MSAPANLSDAAFRASVVGASEVAALFDASPWLTRFELWHRKRGTIATPDFNAVGIDGKPADMRVFCGVMLERAVVDIACALWGYEKVETPKRLDNGAGLGGHPDQLVRCPERGIGVLEIKTADWLVAKQWGDEPPLNYQLQAQTYAGLAKVGWCEVVSLVGGNDPRRFPMEFRPSVYASIEARVAEFWRSVEGGKAPKPDYARDGETIASAIGAPDDTLIDLRRNNRAALLAADFLEAKAREKAAARDADAAKAELLETIGTAGAAMLEGYRIGCGMTKGSAGTLITEEMVGTTIGARKGWRRFDVKEMV